MNDIQTADYRDSPIVSTELVKFLSLNTSVEAVDRLETVTSTLASLFGEINKSFSAQSKLLQSIGNKHDELKKFVDGLKKWVDKLEK